MFVSALLSLTIWLVLGTKATPRCLGFRSRFSFDSVYLHNENYGRPLWYKAMTRSPGKELLCDEVRVEGNVGTGIQQDLVDFMETHSFNIKINQGVKIKLGLSVRKRMDAAQSPFLIKVSLYVKAGSV